MWEGLLPAVAVLLVVVGPGSGLYIAAKVSSNGALEDIAEIKTDLKAFGEAAQTDRTTMLRGLDSVVVLDKEVRALSSQGRASHDLLIAHSHRIRALEEGKGKGKGGP